MSCFEICDGAKEGRFGFWHLFLPSPFAIAFGFFGRLYSPKTPENSRPNTQPEADPPQAENGE
jgi:hypothetical protein